MLVRLMLQLFGHKMSEPGECSFNIAGHGEVDFAFRVVPVKCNANVARAGPIICDLVMLFQCLFQM